MLESTQASQAALRVVCTLRDRGFEAYLAGGCVRDYLMGQTPKDFDVATNAAPNQVRELFKNTQAVGAAFGVILVREANQMIEVATFRTDLEYKDGRHPTAVQFANAEEDSQRRDFTINGLFLDPIENRIIDFVGGQADLAAHRLRAIGNADQRFAEDHLRMLRALRFASRLGFEIEHATARAISIHAQELIRISPERIAEELRKMLTVSTRNHALALLCRFGFLPILMRFLPEKLCTQEVPQLPLLAAILSDKPLVFGSVLTILVLDFRMHCRGGNDLHRWLSPRELKRAAQVMRQTLKISNDESEDMVWSASFIQLLGESPPTVAVMKRFLNQRCSKEAQLIMRALSKLKFLSGSIDAVLIQLDQLRETKFAPPPLISGDDLTANGASPGPKFKLVLDAVYDAQLEDRIGSKNQALELAMSLLRS